MKRTLTLILIAALAATTATAAFAGTPRQERREAHQRARIESGMRSGRLTRHEAMRLGRGQMRIERMERRAMRNDGRMGPRERARIERAQDHQSRHIHRLTHNGRGAV
jgi:hypothetical protein